jgi:hemerythrin-like domain-containing protein
MRREILKTMIKEHEIIETLLNEFEKEYKRDYPESKKILKTLVWNLEKHMFLEEKFLYNVPSLWNGNIGEIFNILKEHGDLLFLVKKLRSSDFTEEDVSDLRELLRDHFTTEEVVLYPKFENGLTEEQRNFFLDRTTEILL